MATRNKKPKCAEANKTCGMACKPKAAICADQRKKLVANSKKAGLKGKAAKEYVQSRIDRYKKLVGGEGARFVSKKLKAEESVKSVKSTSEQLIELGGSVWKDSRIYMNDLASFYGLELDRYKTGNVYSARLDGQKISNSEGNRILAKLNAIKIWYDLDDGKFMYKSDSAKTAEIIIDAIKAKLN